MPDQDCDEYKSINGVPSRMFGFGTQVFCIHLSGKSPLQSEIAGILVT